jgi:four helix bundle protein
MSMGPEILRVRTKKFAVRIVKMFRALPYRPDVQVLGKQLLRCGTSLAANYRAACRGRAKPEWLAKIGLVVEEADETVFWLEMLVDRETVQETKLKELLEEARELSAIFTASQHTARKTG